MKNVLVTGGAGRIAAVISKQLGEKFSFDFVDINPTGGQHKAVINRLDIGANYPGLRNAMLGKDVVIHLAWNSNENWRSLITVPENKTMLENVYRAAVEAKVKRVIMASSVHADDYQNFRGENSGIVGFARTSHNYRGPDSPYGATKIYMEALGEWYSNRHELEVICVRFGGVAVDDKPREEKNYDKIWLSRRDCANLVACCINAEIAPMKFSVFYGVSWNSGRLHDWENPVGWEPQDDYKKTFPS